MTIVLELTPEEETQLKAQGVDTTTLLHKLIARLPNSSGAYLTPEARMAAFDRWITSHSTHTPILGVKSLQRINLYEDEDE